MNPSEKGQRIEITGEDIRNNFVAEPVKPDNSTVAKLLRGSKRIKHDLLSEAFDRPLTQDEIHLLLVIYGEAIPTKKEAAYIASQGREE